MTLSPKFRHVLQEIVKYFAAYILGIALCIICTPAEFWAAYPLFSIFGIFLFYFYLAPEYIFGSNFGYWLIYIGGPIMLGLGVLTHFKWGQRFYAFRFVLLGFPLGFVGALGVYYTIAASI